MQSTGAIAPEGAPSEDIGVLAGVIVSVTPRRRVRSQADVVRLIVALALVGVGVLVASWLRNTIGGAEEDLVDVYELVPDRFADVLTGLAVLGAGVVPVVSIVVLVVRRRFRQVFTLLFAGVGAVLAMQLLTEFLSDQGIIAGINPDTDRIVELTSTSSPTSPLIASAVALVIAATPLLSHQWRRVLWPCVGLLVLFRIVSSNEPPLDVVIAIAVGMAVGSLALLVFGTEGSDPDAPELVAMLRTAGRPRRIEQLPGSAPLVYAVEMADAPPLEMRVRTVHDRSENLLEQLWRSVRLRTWVNDRPYDTVQRRIEHEALAQRTAADAGARVATVRRIVASPQGSVGLLEERVQGAPVVVAARHPASRQATFPSNPVVAVTDATQPLDRDLVLDVWRQLAALHRHRLAHRNLDLNEVWVTPEGRAVLRGFDGAAIAAVDRDLALDRAQLLVSTALVMGATAAVDVAVEALGPAVVMTAVPYLQPLALPAPTRRAWRSKKEVLDGLRTAIARATGVEAAPLARLDRIRPRTAMSLVAFVVAFYVLLPQLGDFGDTVDAASEANWWWLGPMLFGAAATIVFAALQFVASVPEPISFLPALRMQTASSFVSRIAPANTGTLAIGVRFLQRAGLDPGAAAAAVGLTVLSGFVVHLALMGALPAVGRVERRGVLAPRCRRDPPHRRGGALGHRPRHRARPRSAAPGAAAARGAGAQRGVVPGRRAHRPGAGHRPDRRGDRRHGLVHPHAGRGRRRVRGRRELPRDRRRVPRGGRVGLGRPDARGSGSGRGRPGRGAHRVRHGKRAGGVGRAHVPPRDLLAADAPRLVHVPADAAAGGAVRSAAR